MGKKITLDFSKVEERSGWNTKEIPEGIHLFKIELVDLKDANDGTTMWTYGLRPVDPKYKTRLFPYYCKHQQNQLFKLRDIFVAAGLTVPKKKTSLDPDAPVGKLVAAEVSDATGQYAGRSELGGVYERSIIDDEDQVTGDEDEELEDDEEAEEIDDEEYEETEETEEEEADDEDLREEIEALTLPALRKRAKGLGIDTDGVKKDELVELVLEEELGEESDEEDEDELEDDLDDEDLGDDELEEEDFDDLEDDEEEEEPEPAPRRRVAKKAAPAKAAPKAAPARRVVKRR